MTLRRVVMGISGLIGLAAVAGCGALHGATDAPTATTSRPTQRVSLPMALRDTYRYPEPIIKQYPATGVRYLVPSTVGLGAWTGKPTAEVLATLNRIRAAKNIDQVIAYADASYWTTIQHQWILPKSYRAGYRLATEALSPVNVGSLSAADSPYASLIAHQFGSAVLQHSWVLAVGQPGQSFAVWVKRHPALTPWFYFLDVRRHWLLYVVEN